MGRTTKATRLGLTLVLGALALPVAAETERRFPDVLFVTVDTLRRDRVSLYGYSRPTTPAIDALMAAGARLDEARVVEPLTAPSLASMLTAVHPHVHGATRNGLRMRPDLASLPRILAERGYRTAAFVGNWTLRDKLTGLAAHFETYREVLSRKRWGLWKGEATAEDLNAAALAWIGEQAETRPRRPFFAWVHYVEPHAPYRLQEAEARRIGIAVKSELPAADRYDSEVAYVDARIGELLEAVRERVKAEELLVVFASDHGESLGEHGEWGHGRHLFDDVLLVPLSFTWPGRIAAKAVAGPATGLDVAPTVVGLLGLRSPEAFRGFDWSRVLAGDAPPPQGRATYHQAHKGAVQGGRAAASRRKGLLEVGRVADGKKEILRLAGGELLAFDLGRDARERRSTAKRGAAPGPELAAWLERVKKGLVASDSLPPAELDAESLEQLRALGYLD